MSEPTLYAVFAVKKDGGSPLIMSDLTFARIMDEIVIPYNARNQPFRIDGVVVTGDSLAQIKVAEQNGNFEFAFRDLHYGMRRASEPKVRQILGEQYEVRLMAAFREGGLDVTTRMLDTYTQVIKPKLLDYLSNREPLLRLAAETFVGVMQAMR